MVNSLFLVSKLLNPFLIRDKVPSYKKKISRSYYLDWIFYIQRYSSLDFLISSIVHSYRILSFEIWSLVSILVSISWSLALSTVRSVLIFFICSFKVLTSLYKDATLLILKDRLCLFRITYSFELVLCLTISISLGLSPTGLDRSSFPFRSYTKGLSG